MYNSTKHNIKKIIKKIISCKNNIFLGSFTHLLIPFFISTYARKKIIPLKDLQNLFESEECAISYLFETGILSVRNHCHSCGNQMIPRHDKIWRSTRKNCRKSYFILETTFFLSEIRRVRWLLIAWAYQISSGRVTVFSSKSTEPSLAKGNTIWVYEVMVPGS
ncbi:hypothetical protein HZS_3765 [Henneguya salminicola]|nr:hypothetical protein HZS_3765 [Henneguya salminicola]